MERKGMTTMKMLKARKMIVRTRKVVRIWRKTSKHNQVELR